MTTCVRTILLALLGSFVTSVSARADVIWLLEDRYTADTSVQLTGQSGKEHTWSNHHKGTLWGPAGVNELFQSTTGVVDWNGEAKWGRAAVEVTDQSSGSQRGWGYQVIGDRDPPPLGYHTYSEISGYLAFAVSGGNSWLALNTTPGTSPFTFVDLTTGQTLRDSHTRGREFALLDGHMYGLTTFLSLSDSDDGWDAWVATNADINPAPVPEPASLLLLASAVGGMIVRKRRVAWHG